MKATFSGHGLNGITLWKKVSKQLLKHIQKFIDTYM